ncbi:hypothetical protein AVEN_76557-1 [Araneus ventricosus]|uniref:Uncharacterized protein n=1 Tax=Araneus ventricosus TaxID=182803 RepID=A0A4Y2QUW6_ARAVE|nr:hypothetical protein AVEN_76557-1 [Araneus ventricosus]
MGDGAPDCNKMTLGLCPDTHENLSSRSKSLESEEFIDIAFLLSDLGQNGHSSSALVAVPSCTVSTQKAAINHVAQLHQPLLLLLAVAAPYAAGPYALGGGLVAGHVLAAPLVGAPMVWESENSVMEVMWLRIGLGKAICKWTNCNLGL